MKKVLLLTAAAGLALTVSCNRFSTQTYEDNLVMPLAEESADSLTLSIGLEYVTGGLKAEAQEAINGAIAAQAFDLEDLSGTLEECAIRYRENLIDLYLNENEGKEGLGSWEDQLEGSFLPDYKGYKNYILSYYSFRGGAHGITTISYLVFQAKTGAVVSEQDLFQEGFREPVAVFLRESLKEELSDDPELLEIVDMDQVAPNGNFFLDQEGVSWVFQPYEVAPYALGILTASTSWDRLTPYLK